MVIMNDRTVPRIAPGIYEERAFDRLPILADALLDAGCEDEELMRHCRSEGPHDLTAFRGALLFAGPDPDLDVDVSEVLEEKIGARIVHRSQTPNAAATRARWRRIAGHERFHQVDLR